MRRTLWERLSQNAIYECVKCAERQGPGGWLFLDRNEFATCPSCGTTRLQVRSEPDVIDKIDRSMGSSWNKIFGGRLLHCRFCRLQFYDRRPRQKEKKIGTEPLEQRVGD